MGKEAMEICDRCGASIERGNIRYVLRLSVMVDDGGEVLEPIHDHEIDAIIDGLSNVNPADLERGVYEERTFILCAHCRRDYMSDPLGRSSHDPPDFGGGDYLQ